MRFDYSTDFACSTVVRADGLVLQFVENQTPEICLEAVKQNGLALQNVKEQTLEICLAAVKQYEWSFKYVYDELIPELEKLLESEE